MLWAEEPDTHEKLRVVAGEFRTRDIKVGRHVAISPGAIPLFLSHFEEVYGAVDKTDAILASAAAHHRLLGFILFLTAMAASRG